LKNDEIAPSKKHMVEIFETTMAFVPLDTTRKLFMTRSALRWFCNV